MGGNRNPYCRLCEENADSPDPRFPGTADFPHGGAPQREHMENQVRPEPATESENNCGPKPETSLSFPHSPAEISNGKREECQVRPKRRIQIGIPERWVRDQEQSGNRAGDGTEHTA